jgi:hypothetical protein
MTSYPSAVALISGLLFFGIFGVSQTAFAQSQEGIQLRPAVIEDRATPGQTYVFSLKVTNLGANEKTFYIGTQDISGLDDSGKPIFSDIQTPTQFELSAWIKLPADSVDLGPGETKVVDFRLQVPGNAAPGSHFGSIFFTSQPPEQKSNGTAIGYKVGSVITLRIAGNVQEEAQLREFSTDKLVYGTPDVTFRTKIDNLGNDLLRPHGVIQITDLWGKSTTLTVNDSADPIFPGGDRVYTTKWAGGTFAFGRYEAVLSMVYGDDSRKTVSQMTSFWILPLKPIMIALGSLIAIIVVLYLLVRSYIRKKLRDMGVSPDRDQMMQAARYSKPVSRFTTIMFAVLIFSIAFLLLILYFLA